MSYLIPISELRREEAERFRTEAASEVKQRALDAGRAPSADALVIRPVRHNFELGLADATGWQLGVLVAGTLNTYVNIALPAGRWVVFYAISIDSTISALSEIFFRVGAITGSVRFFGVVQDLYSYLETVAYLNVKAFYDEQETIVVQVLPRLAAAAGDVRLVLRGFVAELPGAVVSE